MIIELFSGTGRFQTDEEVIYISKDIKTKPTICADIRYLPLKKNLKPRILHGSPPCRYISKARRWRYGYDFEGIAKTFELYSAFFKVVDWLQPENITFESPGGLEDFLKSKVVFHHPKYDIKRSTTHLYCLTRKQMKRSELNVDVRNHILDISNIPIIS